MYCGEVREGYVFKNRTNVIFLSNFLDNSLHSRRNTNFFWQNLFRVKNVAGINQKKIPNIFIFIIFFYFNKRLFKILLESPIRGLIPFFGLPFQVTNMWSIISSNVDCKYFRCLLGLYCQSGRKFVLSIYRFHLQGWIWSHHWHLWKGNSNS